MEVTSKTEGASIMTSIYADKVLVNGNIHTGSGRARPRGLIEGRGVWADLTQDQSDELVANIEALRDADATHEEIREMIAGKLDVWGLEAPMWSGPHYGDNEQGFRGQRNGYGGNGMGSRMRGQGRGYGGNGGFGQGVCPNVSG
jgi:hypothetical protein